MEKYNFFITPYDTGIQTDIEQEFNCIYKEAKGITEEGDICNAVLEPYAEMNGSRVYIPDEPKHNTTDVTITLYFNKPTALEDSLRFAKFVEGRKVEWYDTFRKKYVTLLMTKAPSPGIEKLYGTKRYRSVSYTFTNIFGTYFNNTQLS